MQLKSLVHRQRSCYANALQNDDAEQQRCQLEQLQVETCIAHFVHLLAHHPALYTKEAIAAAADGNRSDGEGTSHARDHVELQLLVKRDCCERLRAWEKSIGRQGLLKGMADQMDFLLKALFDSKAKMEHISLTSAILSTIHMVC